MKSLSEVSDDSIRYGLLLAYAAACLVLWFVAPSAARELGAWLLSGWRIGAASTIGANFLFLAGFFLLGVPFAASQLLLFSRKCREDQAAVGPQIAANRTQIAKDLAKVTVRFLISLAMGVAGLYLLAANKLALDRSLIPYLVVAVVCYCVLAGAFEFLKYVPIARHLFASRGPS
jgi:hypothetical protein